MANIVTQSGLRLGVCGNNKTRVVNHLRVEPISTTTAILRNPLRFRFTTPKGVVIETCTDPSPSINGLYI